MKTARIQSGKGFTLIEVLLASVAAALILAAIYGVFQHAINLRDNDTRRVRDMRLRTRAATVIRNDLRNAYISGGLFASIVQGDSAGTDGAVNSDYPGYLKITTTTAKDTADALYGDVQEVEYYIVRSSGTAVGGGGDLVRAITRDLLDTDQPVAEEQHVLSGVQSFQVSFYDGANWQSSWEFNTADNSTSGSTASTTSTNSSGNVETLPAAIRVDIQQAAPTAGASAPAPIEILVPWTMQPFTSPTPSPSASPS
jgi:prepilin-type N-terminal cleavage/methylation domain-containing protein